MPTENRKHKWTYEACYEEAKKWATKKEFKENCIGAYASAQKHGWLKNYTWLNHFCKWTYESCKKEALKYKTKGDFRRKANSAYKKACENGWLSEYTWFETHYKWTYDACYQEALKYTTGGEFNNANRSCYETARAAGWIHDYTWLSRNATKGMLTEEFCHEEAKKYKSKKEFYAGSPNVYNKAYREGWLDDYEWLDGRILWTYDKCYDVAKKCKCRQDMKHMSPSAHQKAYKNDWLKNYTWFKERPLSDKNEYLVYGYFIGPTKSAYIGLTTEHRMKTRHQEHVNGRRKHGLTLSDALRDYCCETNTDIPDMEILESGLTATNASEMERYYVDYYKNEGWNILNKVKAGSLGAVAKWDYETCYEIAKKYTRKIDFDKDNHKCYNIAKYHGWLETFTWLESERKGYRKNGTWTYEACYEAAKKFTTSKEFHKTYPGAYSAASKKGWLKEYTWLKNSKNFFGK